MAEKRWLTKYTPPPLPSGKDIRDSHGQRVASDVDLIDDMLDPHVDDPEYRVHLEPIVNGLEGHYHQVELARLIHSEANDKGRQRLIDLGVLGIAKKINYVRNRYKHLSLSKRRELARIAYLDSHSDGNE